MGVYAASGDFCPAHKIITAKANLVRLKARFLFYKGASVPSDLRPLENFLITLALETQSLATHFLHMYMVLVLFFSFVVQLPGR